MTPEEQVAAFLAEHAYVPSGLRGVSRCSCGEQMHGMPHTHRAHVASALLASPVLAEIRAAAAAEALRDVADWARGNALGKVSTHYLYERADRVAPR